MGLPWPPWRRAHGAGLGDKGWYVDNRVDNCLCLVVVAVVLFWWLLSVVVLVVVVLCQKDINKLMYVSSGYIVG